MCTKNSHTFTFAGIVEKLPEGYKCDCGLVAVHYDICPYCGKEKVEFVQFKDGYSMTGINKDDWRDY